MAKHKDKDPNALQRQERLLLRTSNKGTDESLSPQCEPCEGSEPVAAPYFPKSEGLNEAPASIHRARSVSSCSNESLRKAERHDRSVPNTRAMNRTERPLPNELTDVPNAPREAFGFTLGAFALAGVISVVAAYFVDVAPPLGMPWIIVGTSFGLGFEIFRRHRRLVFVRVRVDHIALYRNRRLLFVARRDDFVRYRLSWIRTAQVVVLPTAFAVLGGVFLILSSVASTSQVDASLMVTAITMATWAAVVAAGSFWTRIVCVHYVISNSSHEEKYVVLRRSDAAELGLQ